MTEDQFTRWKDFAFRMARTCFRRRRNPGPRDITGMVEEFFADCKTGAYGIDPECWCSILDWDNCDAYPEGHKFAGTTNFGHRRDHPPYLCDLMDSYEESWMEDYWKGQDTVSWERRRDRWCDPPRCCVRAGFDLAVSPSAGVLGFTAGDIRRMYPEGVPEWIARQWDDAETIGVKAVVPGVGFVPEVVGKSERFEEMADTAGVWL